MNQKNKYQRINCVFNKGVILKYTITTCLSLIISISFIFSSSKNKDVFYVAPDTEFNISEESSVSLDFEEAILLSSITGNGAIELSKRTKLLAGKKNITVLDYFAGSGATAHAVHELNKEDGGERNWIMIEEMGSTFHDVLLKRCEHFDKKKDFLFDNYKTIEKCKDEELKVMYDEFWNENSSFHKLRFDFVYKVIGAQYSLVLIICNRRAFCHSLSTILRCLCQAVFFM